MPFFMQQYFESGVRNMLILTLVELFDFNDAHASALTGFRMSTLAYRFRENTSLERGLLNSSSFLV